MKYLLDYLGTIPDAPNLQDPEFQRLLVDVQAGKTQTKSADSFWEGLEKAVNELKSAQQSFAFHKPVSKREAPDYYEIIKKPMDLSTVLRNIKNHKYKSKADFAADLDLIWENCLLYNTTESHPLRASARFMKQKTDHLLQFVADKNDRTASTLLPLPIAGSSTGTPSRSFGGSQAQTGVARPSPLPEVNGGGDEDAAGESDGGGAGAGDESFRSEGAAPSKSASQPHGGEYNFGRSDGADRPVRGRSGSRDGRGASPSSINGDRRVNGTSSTAVAGSSKQPSPPPFRIKLPTEVDFTPALVRTPQLMTQYLPISLASSSTAHSSYEKGKARDMLLNSAAPAWYPADNVDDEDVKLQAGWWGLATRDDAYVSSLPAVPFMAPAQAAKRKRLQSRSKRKASVVPMDEEGRSPSKTPSLVPSKQVKLESTIRSSVDKLFEAKKVMGHIHEWQRLEIEGGIPPRWDPNDPVEKEGRRQERLERKQREHEEGLESRKRRKLGGEVGEAEAVLSMRKATANMLAHSGFDGANEMALDLFTRAAIDQIQNMGKTFRLLVDTFSQKMSSEEIVLHALQQNGPVGPQDLEAHIKDEIEREKGKITDMTRKLKQAYKEVTTAPVIEDDMMFAENGEMLLDGNFADELGEDFLGFRDMGIDKEEGLHSLTVPTSIFYGRRKRDADASAFGGKTAQPDFPPPPPFVPLNLATLQSHVPALLHAFFAARMESGLGLADDEGFDAPHTQIGMLGQIVVKQPPPLKKKPPVEEQKKVVVKKPVQSGVGKGNWIRPSKEERARKLAEKAAADHKKNGENGLPNGLANGAAGSELDAEGEEEDAAGEEE